MARLNRTSTQAEGNFVGLLVKQVEVGSFGRALMLQPATSNVRRYRSTILRSHMSGACEDRRPDKGHPWS